MGRGGVARVPQLPEQLAALHLVADLDSHRTLLKVRVERVVARAEVEDHVVPIYRTHGDGVGVGQLPRHLVVELVQRVDHGGVVNGNHVRAVGRVVLRLRGVAVDEASLVVETHPVDRVALGIEEPSVDAQDGAPVQNGGRAAPVRCDPGPTLQRRPHAWHLLPPDVERSDGVCQRGRRSGTRPGCGQQVEAVDHPPGNVGGSAERQLDEEEPGSVRLDRPVGRRPRQEGARVSHDVVALERREHARMVAGVEHGEPLERGGRRLGVDEHQLVHHVVLAIGAEDGCGLPAEGRDHHRGEGVGRRALHRRRASRRTRPMTAECEPDQYRHACPT